MLEIEEVMDFLVAVMDGFRVCGGFVGGFDIGWLIRRWER